MGFIPQPHPVRPALIEPFLFALGNGVYLFFLLSAFGLAHSNSGRLGSFRQLAEYSLRRIFRIAPLFYFMILFYWLKFGFPPVGLSGLLANLIFVFNFIPKLHDSLVWAGWTIGVEMPFYAILPFILPFRRRGMLFFTAAALLISILSRAMIATLDNVPPAYAMLAFTSNLLPFAAGLLVYRYSEYRSWSILRGRSGNLLCLLSLLVLAWAIGLQVLRAARFDVLLWSVPFAWLCWLQISSPARWLSTRAMQYCGARSFSLYLVHPPIVYLLGVHGWYTWIEHIFPAMLGVGTFLLCELLTFALLLPIAELTFQFIERPGQMIGNRLVSLLAPDLPTNAKPRLLQRRSHSRRLQRVEELRICLPPDRTPGFQASVDPTRPIDR